MTRKLSYRTDLSRDGHKTDELVSCFQKAIRRGKEDWALYCMAELDEMGFVISVWNRGIVTACEDIGLGDPMVIVQVMSLFQAFLYLESLNGKHVPQRLPMAQAVLLLARSGKPPMSTRKGKSRLIDDLLNVWYLDRPHHKRLPKWVYDKHTADGRARGLTGAAGWKHFFDIGSKLLYTSDLPNPYTARHRKLRLPEEGK